MGNCVSGPDEVEAMHPTIGPTPSSTYGVQPPSESTPVITQRQNSGQQQQPIQEHGNDGITPEHIADREGGCGLNNDCVVHVCICTIDLSSIEGTLFLEFSHVSMKLMNTGAHVHVLYDIRSHINILHVGRQRHSSVRLLPTSPGKHSSVCQYWLILLFIILSVYRTHH